MQLKQNKNRKVLAAGAAKHLDANKVFCLTNQNELIKKKKIWVSQRNLIDIIQEMSSRREKKPKKTKQF